MQKINALFPLSGRYLLTLALLACGEPSEDEEPVAQDDDGQLQIEDGTQLTYVVNDGQAVLDGDIRLGEADALETSFRAAGCAVTPWGGMMTGDPRRLANEPGAPGFIRVMDPIPYD